MIWYEEEVKQLKQRINPAQLNRTVFYGSSSIRLWSTLAQDFPDTPVLNLGFGGSTLAACSWYFEEIVVPSKPRAIVFYAGDNDLGDQRHPEEVYLFFCTLVERLKKKLPDVPLVYVSIKPSLARWDLIEKIKHTNALIAEKIKQTPGFTYLDITHAMLGANHRPRPELFEADGLHLSPAGYQVWTKLLRPYVEKF
ncbi:SGNH/GDSL hydrolase family protein [Siphonobacter sp.]|uniref:SGNH/GDSL hydrolase family protein n=1 Tax=Siphonobacter sp. TaxID=1869184 RepID=UPI003B3BA8BB